MNDLKIFLRACCKVVLWAGFIIGLWHTAQWVFDDNDDEYPYELFGLLEPRHDNALPDSAASRSSYADSTAYRIPGTNTWVYNKPNPRLQIFWNIEKKQFELAESTDAVYFITQSGDTLILIIK